MAEVVELSGRNHPPSVAINTQEPSYASLSVCYNTVWYWCRHVAQQNLNLRTMPSCMQTTKSGVEGCNEALSLSLSVCVALSLTLVLIYFDKIGETEDKASNLAPPPCIRC